MSDKIAALPRRALLSEGESLLSFCARNDKAMWYEEPDTTIKYAYDLVNLKAGRKICPMDRRVYEVLAALTKTDIVALILSTPHRYAYILTHPHQEAPRLYLQDHQYVELLSEGISRKLLLKGPRFCPKCLREHRYHRLYWSMTFVTVCHEHEC